MTFTHLYSSQRFVKDPQRTHPPSWELQQSAVQFCVCSESKKSDSRRTSENLFMESQPSGVQPKSKGFNKIMLIFLVRMQITANLQGLLYNPKVYE